MEEKEILTKVLEETELTKKPTENKDGFIFEITEEEFEKSIKRAIELAK